VPPSPSQIYTRIVMVAIRRSHPCEPYVLPPERCASGTLSWKFRLSSHSRSRASSSTPRSPRPLLISSLSREAKAFTAQACGCRSPCHWESFSRVHTLSLHRWPAYRTCPSGSANSDFRESHTSSRLPSLLSYCLHSSLEISSTSTSSQQEFTSTSPHSPSRSARSPRSRRKETLDPTINYLIWRYGFRDPWLVLDFQVREGAFATSIRCARYLLSIQVGSRS